MMEEVLDRITDGVLVVGREWQITHANSTAQDLLERDASLVGADVRDAFPRSVESTFHEHYAEANSKMEERSFEEYFPDLERWIDVDVRPHDPGLVVLLRDTTARKEQRRELDTRESELQTLTRVNTLIQDLIDSIIGAGDREQIERNVCEQLAGTDLYEFAWVGEVDPTQDGFVVRTAAGSHEELRAQLTESAEQTDALPEHDAIDDGHVHISEQLPADSSIPEPIRRQAFASGIQSCLAVPFVYGGTTYGVLGVYAARPGAFSERERTSFETLGRTIGLAVNATRQRNLILSDTVVELTLQVRGSRPALSAISARLDGCIDVKGTVPVDEQRLLCYVCLEDASTDEFLGQSAERPNVDVNRVIHDAEAGGVLSLTVSGKSPVLSLSERGGSIRAATFDRGTGRIVAEFPPDQDVRTVVEETSEAFEDVSLVSKREEQRHVETAQEFKSDVEETLTERQRTVLETAYLGDYFESPRGSTAEDLAASLDITSPTLHHHLRAAERKLIGAFLEDDGSGPGEEGEPVVRRRDGSS